MLRPWYVISLLPMIGSLFQELDRKCVDGDCAILGVGAGKVYVEYTGAFTGRRLIGTHDAAATAFAPRSEAPVRHGRTSGGWVGVVTSYLPQEFEYMATGLRLRMFHDAGGGSTLAEGYSLLSDFEIGCLFNSQHEFALISSIGAHSYVVQTRVWLLPGNGPPKPVLSVRGLLMEIQRPVDGRPGGLWIKRETYDGVNAATKGKTPEFWQWKDREKRFVLSASRKPER